ncbi:Beta-lactamase hydrolase-like protein [Aquisphaera giovannonii]|uniref:Beta-lactamase hydrolase-like protein n=1 Tax=Aquisphaera giovannonii TaxID=406548 RepID=A0A5B9VZ27_9BACT|nr:sulfur transferase domain-containing protein [Aquisphaera giovannonii]QEH33573.1 Beta-lactamase hydrolase-like protein [Aquisphaera giovannonii]
MNFKHHVTSSITIADQPTAEDLLDCKYEGYVGVVNLRNDGEPEQPLSTSAEGDRVRAVGLEYQHYGVGGKPLSDPGVAEVCDFIDRLAAGEGKVLVHCRKGPRAAALVLIQQARANHWTAAEALEKGPAMGLQVDGPLRAMVVDYLEKRR